MNFANDKKINYGADLGIMESRKAAIYCRLSKVDDKQGESESIKSQRDMLENFCEEKDFEVVAIYQDDGYTGLNTDRPSFQRLLKDVEDKKVDIVITKDLSRLGRNYLQTGYYTENFFPKNEVRYIALNDGVDTLQDNNEIVPFKNVLNEFYSRDVSKKLKSAYLTRARQGTFTGPLAPFGYEKDKDNPYILVIDKQTSWIIEKIFELAIEGNGTQAIRRKLFDSRVPTPTWWNREKGLRNKYTKLEKTVENGEFWWDCTTIKEIIGNPVYIGHIASQKFIQNKKNSMLSSVLRSEMATKVSIRIMRTFVEMRRFLVNNGELFSRLDRVELKQLETSKKLEENDEKFEKVFDYIAEHKEVSQKIFFDGQIYDAFFCSLI